MPVALADLLAVPEFGLRALALPDHPVSVHWAGASDLADPTPFTEPGQLLLTTGSQFRDADSPAALRAYVRRLVDAGVGGLGFGSEVVRAGAPAGLVAACRDAGLPLVEVPYSTPFLALGRWIADREAEQARARLAWAIEAQNAISTAVLGAGGLDSAVTRAASLLDAAIVVLDPDLQPVAASPGADATPDADAERLLARGRRASRRDGGRLVQTLGRAGRLTGALVIRRATAFDEAELSAITTLVALAEVSLEHGRDIRGALHDLLAELYPLLLDGRVDIVRRAIRGLPAGLPGARLVVAVLDEAAPVAALETVERRSGDPRRRTLQVVRSRRRMLLADEREWPAWRAMLRDAGVRAGHSDAVGWERLAIAATQAERALDAAGPGRVLGFRDLVGSSFAGLIADSAAADVARARLAALEDERGDELLGEAAVWLRHNASWEAAARELGIHRHSLKARMHELGDRLGLDLDRFPARAELWALLAAAGRAGP